MELINENNRVSAKINYVDVNNNITNINDSKINNDLSNSNEEDDNININIYRYKFTNEFTDELFKFSKIHQYDHRHDFKDAWKQWTEDNSEIIDIEIRRLTNLGYDGDISDKMFKSARYYFRKKSTENKKPAKRRIYVSVKKELLDSMDEHIIKNTKTENFKPSEGFDEYCKQNTELIKEEVFKLVKEGLNDSNEIKNKIKKTYKNRYFLFISINK